MPARNTGKRSIDTMNEETLQKMDPKNKKVFVVLPEGLLDVYLG